MLWWPPHMALQGPLRQASAIYPFGEFSCLKKTALPEVIAHIQRLIHTVASMPCLHAPTWNNAERPSTLKSPWGWLSTSLQRHGSSISSSANPAFSLPFTGVAPSPPNTWINFLTANLPLRAHFPWNPTWKNPHVQKQVISDIYYCLAIGCNTLLLCKKCSLRWLWRKLKWKINDKM